MSAQERPPHTRRWTAFKGELPAIRLVGAVLALAVAVVVVLFVVLRWQSDASEAGSTTANVGNSGAPTVKIADPVDGVQLSGPVTVRLDVRSVNLTAPVDAVPRGRHVHFFLDIDPATVLMPGRPIPMGQAGIIHTLSTSHTFPDLRPGPHTVWAVLAGNDHVPVSAEISSLPAGPEDGDAPVWAPVADKVSFVVVPGPSANARSAESAPIVYQSVVHGPWRVYMLERIGGTARRLTGGPGHDLNPAFSPDGTRIAFQSDREGTHHIYTMNLDGSDLRRHTSGTSNNRSPAWSPDGTQLVFQSDRDGREHLWVVAVAGGEPRQLTHGPHNDGAPRWSPDGARIVYHSDLAGGPLQIFVLDLRGGTPQQLTDGPHRHTTPAWSPDGGRIAFASLRERRWHIFVMNADGSDPRRLTTDRSGYKPSWSPDGRHLLFSSGVGGGREQIFVMPADGGAARRLAISGVHSQSAAWPMK